MKIGILTFHHTTNFGATLQAYALFTTLKRQGHEVELIDYRPYTAVQYYRNEIQNILNSKRKLINPKNILFLIKLVIKSLKMRMFLRNNMKLSKHKTSINADLKKINLDYDVVISGSDQIWCIDSYRGFDSSFFLDFVNSKLCRKISYAASCNFTNKLGKYQKIVSELISDFDAISVRDSHSLSLIARECDRVATKVLDPTFLIDFKEIREVPNTKKDFILVYNDGKMEAHQESFIKSIADINKLVIVSVGKAVKIADKNIIDVGPAEWIGYFSQAKYVVTNTYHGTIFAIKFKKPFSIFPNAQKTNKVNDLLENLGLINRIVDQEKCNFNGEDFFKIDYTLADEKLEKEISISKNYLLNAINGKKVQVKINLYPSALSKN